MIVVPFSPEIFALDGLADTLLIGPSALFGRGGDFACGSDDEVRRRLLLLLPDRGTVPALRRAFERWRLGVGFAYLSDRMLVDRVAAATRRGRLSAFVVPNAPLKSVLRPDTPRAAHVLASLAPRVQGTAAGPARAAPLPRPGQPAAASSAANVASPAATRVASPSQPTPRRVDALSFEERLIEVLRRTVESKRLPPPDRGELAGLIEPRRFAPTVAVLMAWAASRDLGPGFIFDAVFADIGLSCAPWAGMETAIGIEAVLDRLRAATSEADLDRAAALLADAIALVGVTRFAAAVFRGAERVSGKGISARSGRRYEEPTRPAEQIQLRSGRVSGNGNEPRLHSNRALHEEQKRGYRRQMEKPHVTDPGLKRIVDSNYRKGAKIGSGSTADAVRHEAATGQRVAGRSHQQKAEDTIRALKKWLDKHPEARQGDKAAAENMVLDLEDALGGNK